MPVTRIKNNVVTDSNITPSKLAVTTAMQTFLSSATSANLAATVSGTTGTGNLVFANNPTFSSANVTGNLTVDTDTLFVDSANNRVGIGTTSGFGTLNIFRNVANSVINLNDTFTRAGASVRSSSSTDTTLNIAAHANNTTILQVANSNGTASYNMSLNTYGGNVGIGTTTIDTSARLQVDSTTQGFLPPRMTISQRNAIATPAAGLTVYTTDGFNMSYHNGTSWGDVFSSHSSSFTSESLRNAVSDETGSGSLVFNTGPSFVGPVNLTGQDASTAERVMNRALSDARYQTILDFPVTSSATTLANGINPFAGSNAGPSYIVGYSAGTAVDSRHAIQLQTPCIVNNNTDYSYFSGTGQGSIIDFSIPWSVSFKLIFPRNITGDDILRVAVGELFAGGITVPAFGANGFGIRLNQKAGSSTIYEVRIIGKVRSGWQANFITGATNTSPITITCAGHGLTNNDFVEIVNVGGNTAANGIFQINNVTSTTFDLIGSSGNGSFTSNGAFSKISQPVEILTGRSYDITMRNTVSGTTYGCELSINNQVVLSLSGINRLHDLLNVRSNAGMRAGIQNVSNTIAQMYFIIANIRFSQPIN